VEKKLICNWRKINKSLEDERKSLFLNFVLLLSIVRIFKFEILNALEHKHEKLRFFEHRPRETSGDDRPGLRKQGKRTTKTDT
jgi:hypothetical protein